MKELASRKFAIVAKYHNNYCKKESAANGRTQPHGKVKQSSIWLWCWCDNRIERMNEINKLRCMEVVRCGGATSRKQSNDGWTRPVVQTEPASPIHVINHLQRRSFSAVERVSAKF